MKIKEIFIDGNSINKVYKNDEIIWQKNKDVILNVSFIGDGSRHRYVTIRSDEISKLRDYTHIEFHNTIYPIENLENLHENEYLYNNIGFIAYFYTIFGSNLGQSGYQTQIKLHNLSNFEKIGEESVTTNGNSITFKNTDFDRNLLNSKFYVLNDVLNGYIRNNLEINEGNVIIPENENDKGYNITSMGIEPTNYTIYFYNIS